MKTANDSEKQCGNTGDFTCPALVCSPEKCLAAAQGSNGSALPVWPGWRGRHGDAKSTHTHTHTSLLPLVQIGVLGSSKTSIYLIFSLSW